MSNMQWPLEVLLIGLLLATLFHALRLEKALGVLRRDRAALEELVTGFNDSTRQIARQVDQAKTLKNDLTFLTERGEKLADQLDNLVRQARPSVEASHSIPRVASRPVPQLHAVVDEAPSVQRDGRVRSHAEKELLRALKMAR